MILSPLLANAEKCYVFIDQSGEEKGLENGQNSIGDVVDIYPVSSDRNPTENEKAAYKIIVVDLTDADKAELMREEVEISYFGGDLSKPIRTTLDDRVKQINLKKFDAETDGEEVTKVEFNKSVGIKPTAINVIDE
jgi:hypothetical protein